MAEKEKISKIRIVRSCIVNGEHAEEGKTFDVPKEVPEADAKYLIGIKKAEDISNQPVEKPAKK